MRFRLSRVKAGVYTSHTVAVVLWGVVTDGTGTIAWNILEDPLWCLCVQVRRDGIRGKLTICP